MKVLIKGGVWKNTEDEILKAAVMKYGKNQWARISSLLTRKTPKQCKARWFEWLDPSIKKTEWSKEEDEKLLHLAKLMPTQWRTIAPIVGRTAAQCLERYQKLLDEAEALEAGDAGPSSDDVRKLRPGEIDPDPETKPARPDPVDMDDDEKEMLSEARARLVNTQGKKAKRKAREKQLEEARRLAYLQKRRELKAAGLDTKVKRRIQGVDYNADIPFYKPQPAGFWDINEEIAKEKSTKVDLTNTLLSKLSGKRTIEIEEEERKKDAKKFKMKKEKGELLSTDSLKNLEDTAISARGRLNLPTPQISETEMEQIVKFGTVAEMTKSVVDDGNSMPSSSLLGEYSSSFRGPTPMRTPKSSTNADSIHQQALNLRAMTEAPTPLLGDQINLQGDLDFNGVTPRRTIAATPNPLASQLTPRTNVPSESAARVTPASFSSLTSKTPIRDAIGINNSRGGFESTPLTSSSEKIGTASRLGGLFSALPKPKNEFEIVIPESLEFNSSQEQSMNHIIPDAEDLAQTARNERERQEKIRFARLSKAVQLDLPRPKLDSSFVSHISSEPSKADLNVTELIQIEKTKLVIHDAINHPILGQESIPGATDTLDLSLDLAGAQSLVDNEMSTTVPRFDISLTILEQMEQESELIIRDLQGLKYGKADISRNDKLDSLKNELGVYRQLMKDRALKAQGAEKKLNIKLGGYIARSKILHKQFFDAYESVSDSRIQEHSFRVLAQFEESNIQSRIWRARQELEAMVGMEDDLQSTYRQLLESINV